MRIDLELFYTPANARWEMHEPPRPLASVCLTDGTSNPMVLIGRHHDTMNSNWPAVARYPTIIIELKDGPDTSRPGSSPLRRVSRFAARLWWDPETGVQVARESGAQGTPVSVRSRGCTGIRELEPLDVYATGATEIVMRLGWDGFWLRTVADLHSWEADPGDWIHDREATDAVIGEAADAIAKLFFCSAAPEDACHVLKPDVKCDEREHGGRRRNLGALMAYCLPQLAWPPQGWYQPEELTSVRMARARGVLGTRTNPANVMREVLQTVANLTSIRYLPTEAPKILDLAIKHRILPIAFWHEASRFAHAVPVDWSAHPKPGIVGDERLPFTGVARVVTHRAL